MKIKYEAKRSTPTAVALTVSVALAGTGETVFPVAVAGAMIGAPAVETQAGPLVKNPI